MREVWSQEPTIAKVVRPRRAMAGGRYRPSVFAYPFQAQGRRYLFHTLTRQCLDLEGFDFAGRTYSAGEIEQSEPLSALLAGRFLVPEGEDEAAHYLSVVRLLRMRAPRRGFRTYTILPTTACNARCVYCFEEGMRQVSMTDETVAALIRFILQSRDAEKPARLAWFGGEPLLGKRTIDRVCAALSEAGAAFESSMITNGSLIDGEILDRMAGPWRVKSVQLSMDCAEEEYIRRKRYDRYDDQYHRVMRAAGEMAGRGVRVTVRCNVDEENLSGIDAFLSDLAAAVPDPSRVGVYFLPLYDVQNDAAGAKVWAACAQAGERLRKAGFSGAGGARLHRLKLAYCMCESPYECVVVSPDGLLYGCEHCPEGASFGNVWEGITDPSLLASFALPEEPRPQCRGCPFLPECTSFTRCPVKKALCREVEEALLSQALRREVAGAGADDADEEAPDMC